MAKTDTLPLNPPPADQAEEEESGRRMDPELRTMGAMLRMLADLDDAACARVVRYLSARFPSADQG